MNLCKLSDFRWLGILIKRNWKTPSKKKERTNTKFVNFTTTTAHQSTIFVNIAATKPIVVKLSSVKLVKARPPTTGKRDRLT